MAAKLVLITGASSGIGEATAKLYGARGDHVLLLARDEDRLGDVTEAIRKGGGMATPYSVDLAESAAIEDVATRIRSDIGTPDILINNAGAGRWKKLLDTTAEEALGMIAVPYLAAFNLTRAFLPNMITRRSGRIACITSPASYLAWPHAAAYIAARSALAGFTEALRADLKGTGIGVTLVVLGLVETPYWQHNPGSREHVPTPSSWLAPILTAEQAAKAIAAGVDAGKRTVVRPASLRALFLLNALAPRLVASQLRRMIHKRAN
jgi:uncharacterized protein